MLAKVTKGTIAHWKNLCRESHVKGLRSTSVRIGRLLKEKRARPTLRSGSMGVEFGRHLKAEKLGFPSERFFPTHCVIFHLAHEKKPFKSS